MTTTAALIRPGLLISLKTSLRGGVEYRRVDLDVSEVKNEHTEEADISRWETTKVIEDKEEFERATKVRNSATYLIRKWCANTAFGLLCPIANENELDNAMQEARALVAKHNETAKATQVGIFILKGRIAETDQEAIRSLSWEMKGLLDQMNRGIDKLDPEAIRESVKKALEMQSMLSPEMSDKVGAAIKAARAAARTIVKRVQKEGETAAIVLADIRRGDILNARMSFLDLGEEQQVGEELPAANLQRFADLDND